MRVLEYHTFTQLKITGKEEKKRKKYFQYSIFSWKHYFSSHWFFGFFKFIILFSLSNLFIYLYSLVVECFIGEQGRILCSGIFFGGRSWWWMVSRWQVCLLDVLRANKDMPMVWYKLHSWSHFAFAFALCVASFALGYFNCQLLWDCSQKTFWARASCVVFTIILLHTQVGFTSKIIDSLSFFHIYIYIYSILTNFWNCRIPSMGPFEVGALVVGTSGGGSQGPKQKGLIQWWKLGKLFCLHWLPILDSWRQWPKLSLTIINNNNKILREQICD